MVDRGKLEHIIGDLYGELLGFALKYVGVRADAEDLVQDTLLKIWEYTDNIRTLKTVRALMYKTLRNKIVDFMRKKKYPTVSIDSLIISTIDEYDADKDTFNVWDYVEKLPDEERKVIQLRFKERLSVKETAEAMGRSVAGIKSLQYRAIRRLREMMNGEKD